MDEQWGRCGRELRSDTSLFVPGCLLDPVGRDDPGRERQRESVQTSHNSDLQLSLATSTTRRTVTRSP